MATISASTTDAFLMGNKRVTVLTFTTIANGDTIAVAGINRIDHASCNMTMGTVTATDGLNASFATNVLTFKVSGTPTAASVVVFGN